MYNIINKSENFYIFNLETYQYFNQMFSLRELINHISYYNRPTFIKTKYRNDFLDNINMTLKDITPCYIFLCNNVCQVYKNELKKYVIVDGYERIIDIRDYKDSILANKYISFYSNPRNQHLAKFRVDPVPHTGTKLKRNTKDHRVPKLANELKNCDKEIEMYIRPKRRSKALMQEIKYKSFQKSWKTQSKNKAQWMKG